MLTERLIARIRGQLEVGTPDLEARSLAGEYATLCQRTANGWSNVRPSSGPATTTPLSKSPNRNPTSSASVRS